MPAYNTQQIGNSLKVGAVHDTPDSFVWEIGHTSPFTSPGQPVLLAGRGGLLLLRRGGMAQPLAADPHPQRHLRGRLASQLVGGCVRLRRQSRGARPTETGSTCTSYGGPFCIYPWYTQNADGSFTYGVNYPTTAHDFGRVNQFPQHPPSGGGPFGPNSTYCARVIVH